MPLYHAASDRPPKVSPVAAVSLKFVPGVDMSYEHSATALATALVHPDLVWSVHADDDDDDAGGMDAQRGPQAAKYDSQDMDKQGVNNIREEEAGEITQGSEKAVSGCAAKGFAYHGDQPVEEEVDGGDDLKDGAKNKRRPGRPRKKSVDGEVGEFVNTSKPARSSVEKKEAISFAADRPTRERKSIDRFIASAQKENMKELHIKQGSGTLLKDIPNVVFKISKRYKHDEALGQLHSVLFNMRGKAAVIKQHILQFSGFVWGDNQEKERAKVQEKLERYTKDSLVQFVDVLDIHVSRNLKKEDLVARVLEFLEKPCQTTDTLLELKKHERRILGKRPLSGKKQGRPKIQKASKNRDKQNAFEDGATDASEKCIDNELLEDEVKQKSLNFKDDMYHEDLSEEEKQRAQDSSTIIKQGILEKVAEKEENQDDTEVPVPPRKKCKVEAHDVAFLTPSKSADKIYSKKSVPTSGKRDSKSATNEKGMLVAEKAKKSYVNRRNSTKIKIPSDRELQSKIQELLREADFSKVTFNDVVSQLERIFEVSLIEQKGHVKGLIRDEISKLSEGEDELRTGRLLPCQ